VPTKERRQVQHRTTDGPRAPAIILDSLVDDFRRVKLLRTAGPRAGRCEPLKDVGYGKTSGAKPSVFDSKAFDTDEKYSFRFKTRGSYEYYCKMHPHMIGRIIVA